MYFEDFVIISLYRFPVDPLERLNLTIRTTFFFYLLDLQN